MQTFSRYLFKELLKNFSAVFFILQAIITSHVLTQLFEDSIQGKYSYNAVFWIFIYISLDTVIVTLPFSVMLAVLLTFGRYHRDNELCAAFSVGVGYCEIVKVMAVFTLPLAALLFMFMMEVSPALKVRHEQIKISLQEGMDIGAVTAGKFISAGEGFVIFVEDYDRRESELKNIFIAKQDKSIVEIAKSGRQIIHEDGNKRFHLYQGHRYQGIPGKTSFHFTEFDEHWIELPQVNLPFKYKDVKAYSLKDLDMAQLSARAELHRRLSIPAILILLSFFAFAISKPSRQRNMRNDRYTRLAIGILFFLIYTNGSILLVNLGSNHAGFLYLMWAAHGMLAVYVFLALSGWSRQKVLRFILTKQADAYS